MRKKNRPFPHRVGFAWSSLLLPVLVLLLVFHAPAASAAAPGTDSRSTWHVVLIRNWDVHFRINALRERALRETMMRDAPRTIDIYTEELDTLRFDAPEIEQDFLVYLRKKYRGRHIDLVIASGPEPLQFAMRYRDSVWPNAPVLFHGIVDGTLDPAALARATTGVTMPLDVRSTLALGTALAPQARTVHFIAGDAPFDRMYLDHAVRALRSAPSVLQPHYIVGLPRADLLGQVAKIEPDALVFVLTVVRDGGGHVYPPDGALVDEIAARSRAPVLSAIATQLHGDVVGGFSADIEAHGAAAGRLARALLEGADAATLPVRPEPASRCVVQWKALGRHGLDPSRLPSGCTILGRPPSLWSDYYAPMLGLASVVLLEAALIYGLYVQSRRRRIAEAALRARTAEMTRIAHLSMVGALTAGIAHEINQPMGAILSNAEAAQMMLDQGRLDPAKLREILDDIRNEDLRASEVIQGLRRLLARRESKMVPLELNAQVAEALQHLAFEAARRGIRLSPSFDGAAPAVLGDAIPLQQAVMNLVINAMDALAEAPDADREVLVSTRALDSGAQIIVADRGSGIPPHEAERLFDSLFTTKAHGMGLGLSIARDIVELHGGKVTYEPNRPQGAIFRIRLPGLDR